MSQVIVYMNSEGTNICICHPTGEIPIKEVLAKDCPSGAVIIDSSVLPQGLGALFFDAWELNGTTVTVNFKKAKDIKLAQFNAAAVQVAQKRQLNTLTGLANTPDDAAWINDLTTKRNSIANASTLDELSNIPNPS